MRGDAAGHLQGVTDDGHGVVLTVVVDDGLVDRKQRYHPVAMPTSSDLLLAAESLKNMLVARATGDTTDRDHEYRGHREILIASPGTKAKLPNFVLTCRTLYEFWGFIQPKFGAYQQRREFLRDEFDPLLTMLEGGASSPGDESATDLLTRLDWNEVQAAWRKALDRKATDPDGAITAARTLLESVCKHVLDDAGVAYDQSADMPKLYGLTAETLNLAPSKHTEKVFKQILGGCQAVVEGLGALRSRVGDAHGQGRRPIKPAPRHAELAVNLAGAVATFLAQSWEKTRSDTGGRAP